MWPRPDYARSLRFAGIRTLCAALQRTWKLPPWLPVSQYATPNQTSRAAGNTGSCDARWLEMRDAVANGFRAAAHAVKPVGTRRNRTSSAVSGAGVGKVRNNQGENMGFFRKPPHPDGPRRPGPAAGYLPAAGGLALGNGMIADGGVPCHCCLHDTVRSPAAVTKPALPGRKFCYSTAKEGVGERTTSHTPLVDKSAHERPPLRSGARQELAAATNSNYAGYRPRERLLPKVKSRQRSFHSAPGRL